MLIKVLIKILGGTPWWVYGILAYLVYFIVKSSKTQVVPFNRIAILGFAFFVFSIKRIQPWIDVHDLVPYIWLSAFMIGALLGMLLLMQQDIKVDKQKWLVQVPANWAMPVLITFVFLSNYSGGIVGAMNPSYTNDLSFVGSVVASAALPAGIFVGRVLYLLRCMAKGPYMNLSEQKNTL